MTPEQIAILTYYDSLGNQHGSVMATARHFGIDRGKIYRLLDKRGNVPPKKAQVSDFDEQVARVVAQTLRTMGIAPPVPTADAPSVSPIITKRTLIFTAWEIRVKPDAAFLDCLCQLARKYDAEIYLVPIWPDDIKFLPDSLRDFTVLSSNLAINDNLLFKYVPTHALVQSPIAGWAGALEQSAIIPGLIRDLRTLPASHLSKQVMSTGSCGRLDASLLDYSHLETEEGRQSFTQRWLSVANRRNAKAYAVAQQYTVPSALIVDILDEKTFVTRYVSMPQKQDFIYDLNLKFTAGQESPEMAQPAALVIGDLHAIDRDESTYQAGLEMLRTLKPRAAVLNDAFDAMSCAKFERQDAATYQYAPTLEKEAAVTIACLLEIAGLVPELVYLHSNHDDHLLDFLQNENNWKLNGNYATAHKLQGYRMETGRHPITKLLRMDNIANLRFVTATENYRFGKVLTKHGHEGKSGRRVDFLALAQVYNHYVDGHGHSPCAYRNAVRVGTTSNLRPGYAIGASGWLGANAIINDDASVQLLPIIEGRWRL